MIHAPHSFPDSIERTSHWRPLPHGEHYYWLLYYSYLSPQQLQNTDEIIEKLRPHIANISHRTYYRKRPEAIQALSAILWGYTSKEHLKILDKFFPENEE